MKIHGIVYVLIGLFIAAFAKYAGNASLRPFFYLGLLFIPIGAIKLVITYFSGKEEREKMPRSVHAQPQSHHQMHQTPQQAQGIKHCAKCHHAERSTANFCSHCGNRNFYRRTAV